jgi:hypothetical protein
VTTKTLSKPINLQTIALKLLNNERIVSQLKNGDKVITALDLASKIPSLSSLGKMPLIQLRSHEKDNTYLIPSIYQKDNRCVITLPDINASITEDFEICEWKAGDVNRAIIRSKKHDVALNAAIIFTNYVLETIQVEHDNCLEGEGTETLDSRWLKPAPEIELPLRTLPINTVFTILGVTVQMVGVHEKKGTIYDHKDLQEYASVNGKQLRHRPIKHDFAPLDHLERHGHQVELKVYNSVHKTDLYDNELPVCLFDNFNHFSLAEWLMIFTGEAKERMLDLTLNGKSRIVEMTRRFRTFTKCLKKGTQISDAIELPFHLVLDGRVYRVKIRVIDTCALHGVASYKNLAKATGIELEYKDSLTQYDLENDHNQAIFHKTPDYDPFQSSYKKRCNCYTVVNLYTVIQT